VHCRVATIQATTEIGEGLGGFGCKHRSRGQLVREGETALAIDRCRPVVITGPDASISAVQRSLPFVSRSRMGTIGQKRKYTIVRFMRPGWRVKQRA
jgi:hypothetical protein